METGTMTAPTFYTDEGTRFCGAPGCERSATHHTPGTLAELRDRGAHRWACVFHAPGTWHERLSIMPTITQGQTSDLKAEVSGHRIWLSRMTRADGAEYDEAVEVEVFQPIDHRWTVLGTFDSHGTTAAGLFDGPGLP